ncbi:MAG: hypothetical protein M3Y65_06520 [Pseudomonadota bacterium]|nr:hypothetical protein [Pseudomonadota bacterium]
MSVPAAGSLTHNLHEVRRTPVDAPVSGWVVGFNAWMRDKLVTKHHAALLGYRKLAQMAGKNDPIESIFCHCLWRWVLQVPARAQLCCRQASNTACLP